jgi:hypothetical protein
MGRTATMTDNEPSPEPLPDSSIPPEFIGKSRPAIGLTSKPV